MREDRFKLTPALKQTNGVTRLRYDDYHKYVGKYETAYKALAIIGIPLLITGCLILGLGSGDTVSAGLSILYISLILLFGVFVLPFCGGKYVETRKIPEGPIAWSY
jgi:hypothetical protein